MKTTSLKPFTQQQLEELREAAAWILEQEKLEAQSWEDAWNGKYPDKPKPNEIQEELEQLILKARRLLSGNADFDEEHFNHEERVRIIALGNCPSLDIWGE